MANVVARFAMMSTHIDDVISLLFEVGAHTSSRLRRRRFVDVLDPAKALPSALLFLLADTPRGGVLF